MTVTFNSSLKWILLTMLYRCIAEIISALKNVLLLLLLHCEAKELCGWNEDKYAIEHVYIDLISLAFHLQQTRRPVGAAESKCQMRSCLCLGAATLRFLLQYFLSLRPLFCNFCYLTLPPLICQYAPLSLRPLTCEVKVGHRWGPREQGCIQFQRPTIKNMTWWSIRFSFSMFTQTTLNRRKASEATM